MDAAVHIRPVFGESVDGHLLNTRRKSQNSEKGKQEKQARVREHVEKPLCVCVPNSNLIRVACT